MIDSCIRRGIRAALAFALLAAAACAAPPSTDAPTATESARVAERLPADPVAPAADTPAFDPMGQLSAPAAAGSPVQVDTSCRTDADCTVKDVGNCCGAYPACVNVDSPTDPEGVRAACAASGRMSVCGFREIQGCQCVQGSCQADGTGAAIPVQ